MEERADRLAEMVLWLMDRPDVERALYGSYPTIKDENVLMLFRELKRREYYELFVFFLLRGELGMGVQRALDRFCAEKLLEEAKRAGLGTAFDEFEKLLEEAVGTP